LESRLDGFCGCTEVGDKLADAAPKGDIDGSLEGIIVCDSEDEMLGKLVMFLESEVGIEGRGVGLANKFETGRLD
jgi:hypothetical protein